MKPFRTLGGAATLALVLTLSACGSSHQATSHDPTSTAAAITTKAGPARYGDLPAAAQTKCHVVDGAAAFFFQGFHYKLSVQGEVHGTNGPVDAKFAPVTCTAAAVPSVDPITATKPSDPSSALDRLSRFVDKYFDHTSWYDNFGYSTAGTNTTLSFGVRDAAATKGQAHCGELTQIATLFLGLGSRRIEVHGTDQFTNGATPTPAWPAVPCP